MLWHILHLSNIKQDLLPSDAHCFALWTHQHPLDKRNQRSEGGVLRGREVDNELPIHKILHSLSIFIGVWLGTHGMTAKNDLIKNDSQRPHIRVTVRVSIEDELWGRILRSTTSLRIHRNLANITFTFMLQLILMRLTPRLPMLSILRAQPRSQMTYWFTPCSRILAGLMSRCKILFSYRSNRPLATW